MLNRLLIIISYMLLFTCSNAQRVIDVDKFDGSAMTLLKSVGGEPFSSARFVRVVDGSPYFTDQWLKGSVFVEESEYRNVLLRLNIFETTLEFKDVKGEVMVCTQPVKKVALRDSASGSSYNFVHSAFLPTSSEFKNCWLLELVAGNVSLYKLAKKQINEVRPYGSATAEQHITTNYSYFILQNNNFTRIRKIGDIFEILSNKKNELQEYIKVNKLSSKEESDFVKLISYYNSL